MIEKIYNILSYAIFIIAILITIIMIPMLLAALANPLMLISLFIFACIVIYSFVSFKFNGVTVQAKQPTKSSAKAWLNINSFIGLFFAIQLLIGAYQIFQNPTILMQQMDIFYSQMPDIGNVKMPSKEKMFQVIKIMISALSVYALILLTHIFLTYSLMKKYKQFFVD